LQVAGKRKGREEEQFVWPRRVLRSIGEKEARNLQVGVRWKGDKTPESCAVKSFVVKIGKKTLAVGSAKNAESLGREGRTT